MEPNHTKEAAESILRELPPVMGAFVREDIRGHPREIHLLVSAGPVARDLARDVRALLEEQLGIPIDQRIISIAQLARPVELEGGKESGAREPSVDELRDADAMGSVAPVPPPSSSGEPRLVLEQLESHASDGRVRVVVRVASGGRTFDGSGVAVTGGTGRPRAAAEATLAAAEKASEGRIRLESTHTQRVLALGREYVVVGVLAAATRLGRRPLHLLGAWPITGDAEDAAALATLQAVNRTIGPELETAGR